MNKSTITADGLSALRRAATKATPGSWCAFVNEKTNIFAIHTPDDQRCGNIIDWMGFDGVDCSKKQKAANAKFIAATDPETIIALLDVIDQLTARNAELEIGVENMTFNTQELDRVLIKREERAEKAESRVAELEEELARLKRKP